MFLVVLVWRQSALGGGANRRWAVAPIGAGRWRQLGGCRADPQVAQKAHTNVGEAAAGAAVAAARLLRLQVGSRIASWNLQHCISQTLCPHAQRRMGGEGGAITLFTGVTGPCCSSR